MPDIHQSIFIIFVGTALALIIAIGIGIFPGEQIYLGDEVTTTDRYNALFNDSFTGHVVTTMADGMYTVRDENGTERTFERTWLDHVDDGGDI